VEQVDYNTSHKDAIDGKVHITLPFTAIMAVSRKKGGDWGETARERIDCKQWPTVFNSVNGLKRGSTRSNNKNEIRDSNGKRNGFIRQQ